MQDEIRVHTLETLVEYQGGSIVSKTLIKEKTGTITLFAFDQGQELSEHTAPFSAMVNILDGEAQIIVSGNPFTVKRGEMIIMPGGQPHALKAVKQFKMMLTMIKA